MRSLGRCGLTAVGALALALCTPIAGATSKFWIKAGGKKLAAEAASPAALMPEPSLFASMSIVVLFFSMRHGRPIAFRRSICTEERFL